MTGWKPALRLAWRDVLRSRGRSLLVLVMITLPVLAVTAAAVLFATQDVSGAEGIERRIGTADAQVSFIGSDVRQSPDPDDALNWKPHPVKREVPEQVAAIREVLGAAVQVLERREANVRLRTDHGTARVVAHEIDLREPVTDGLFELEDGRLPESADEAVVTQALADRGPGLDEELVLARGLTLRVVGIVRDGTYVDRESAVTLAGGFGLKGGSGWASAGDWLVDSTQPVTWEDVQALNRQGAKVVSAEVLRNPPSAAELGLDDIESGTMGGDDSDLQVAALIVVMILIEVVLLAGPAFAVGARRQQRNLALIAVAGGTPRQMRRVILATAVVLGSFAAVLGIALGLLAAWLLVPVVQQSSGEWFGPFEVPWWQLAGIAGFGLVSALLAAFVPAWLASRQDVVAVLGGRRGERPPSLRSPLLGLILLGIGVALAVAATQRDIDGEFAVAVSAVPTVLGMVLLIPLCLALVARTARWLPLPLRFALRDAVRHRTRTAPAVAAVAATVAGVVALGIAVTSDQAESRETYQPVLAVGDAMVSNPSGNPVDESTWTRAVKAVREQVGDDDVVVVRGLAEPEGGWLDVWLRDEQGRSPISEWSPAYGAPLLVGTEMPALEFGLDDQQLDEADEILSRGGAVVLATDEAAGDRARIRVAAFGRNGGRAESQASAMVDAVFLSVDPEYARALAVVAPSVAAELGQQAQTVGALVRGPVSEAMEKDIEEAARAAMPGASVAVERGYQEEDAYRIALLILTALGGLLMLGGTLTATFLSLSDARPDLATLRAVGGAPRTRRAVAAAYALVVGLVGAVLGAATGFVPGLAVVYPLTAPGYSSTGPYFDIPWLMVVAVVVGLPLFTALVVGVFARSRLPMVARLD